jgi:hypothetical protein
MIYSAFLKKISEEVEGEVTLLVNGLELTCFANMPPKLSMTGQECSVEFMPMIFDDYEVKEISASSTPAIQRIGNSFSYVVSGRLLNGSLDGDAISFDDEILESEFGYLDGKMIAWKIDRLDVEFQ